MQFPLIGKLETRLLDLRAGSVDGPMDGIEFGMGVPNLPEFAEPPRDFRFSEDLCRH
jgi:hypothetical protein